MGWHLDLDHADPERAPGLLRAVGTSLVALTILLVVGTVGFVLIEEWTVLDALWMVVITLSTIGYGEVHELSQAGRLFTLLFIVAGIGVATRGLSDIARYVAEGGLVADLLQRRHWREVQRMRDHYIVVGYGRLGREIVADLLHDGAQVLVIDLDPADLPEGVGQIVGDATHDDVLLDAGIQRARGLAIATPSDAVNVYITLSARQLHATLQITTRIEDDNAQTKAIRAGANGVLMPYHISGARMAQGLLRPGASMFVDHATTRHFDDLLIEDVILPQTTELSGPLRDLDLPHRHGVIVVAVCHAGDDHLTTPEPDMTLGPGDTLVVVGPPPKVKAFADHTRR